MAVGDRFVLDEKEGRTYNRIDKKDEWAAANPVLEIGEIGIEKDGLLMNVKIGDGQTAWNALGYRFKQCPYEVGDIFMTLNATNPAVRWPGTKWEAFAPGRVLIGAGTGTDSRGESRTFKIGDTGGEYQHQLTTGELPSHNHSTVGQVPKINLDTGSSQTWGHSRTDNNWWFQDVSTSVQYTGSNQAHNIMMAYCAVNIWHRID